MSIPLATQGASRAAPQTIGDALVVEMLDELAQLRQGIAELPQQLDRAMHPGCTRLERLNGDLQRQLDQFAQAIGGSATPHSAPGGPPPPRPASPSVPRRITSSHEAARRFSLTEVLLASAIGIIAGLLIAATLNLRIPGLSG